MPIATITDAYSVYAIYPQAKPLIDQSTLVKVEGRITIHSQPESKTEGFVFVMPEAHPAVTGFEMMLRWLFPVYDIFGLYGRPRSLIADTLNTRGLMFAMPRQKRYGYLEIIDVARLIHTDGSKDWSEREWRKQMKELTSHRMELRRTALSREGSQLGGRRGPRTSLPSRPADFRYDDNASVRSTPSMNSQNNQSTEAAFATSQKAGTAPPDGSIPPPSHSSRTRAISESVALPSPSRSRRQKDSYVPSRLSTDHEEVEMQAGSLAPNQHLPHRNEQMSRETQQGRDSSESDRRQAPGVAPNDIRHDLSAAPPTGIVTAPPAFTHQEGDKPQTRPQASPEMRHASNRMSTATFAQMVDATGIRSLNGETAAAGAVAAWNSRNGGRGEDGHVSGVIGIPQRSEMTTDQDVLHESLLGGKPSEEGQISSSQTTLDSLQPPPYQHPLSGAKSITRRALPSQTATDSHVEPVTKESRIGASLIAASTGPTDDSQLQQDNVQPLQEHHDSEDKKGNDENINDSPGHASSRQFTQCHETDHSEVRTRAGVLKFIGHPTSNEEAPPMPTREAPTINFGPTISLAPTYGGQPSRSESVNASAQRNQNDQARGFPANPTQMTGQRSSFHGRPSPIAAVDSRPGLHSRSASYDKRIMAWQPGALIGAGRQSPVPAITPEEFVQRRASANRTPSGYVPRRSHSSGYFGADPPVSGDSSRKKDTPPRLESRGPSPMMAQQQEYSSRLSAHEQEHVARMTGSPLISVPRKSENQAGLIGAIHAREQEKKNMRDGVSGQMVQHAIAQRNQQAHTQMQAQQAAQVAYGHSQQNQGYLDGRGHPASAATWGPQQPFTQNAQWTGYQDQGQIGSNVPQQNSFPQHNPTYMGYYNQQNGYQ